MPPRRKSMTETPGQDNGSELVQLNVRLRPGVIWLYKKGCQGSGKSMGARLCELIENDASEKNLIGNHGDWLIETARKGVSEAFREYEETCRKLGATPTLALTNLDIPGAHNIAVAPEQAATQTTSSHSLGK